MHIADLTTPALVVDEAALERNLATMSDAHPGAALRPHVKAHKTSELGRRQAAHGHRGFTAATVRECVGMADAGLGEGFEVMAMQEGHEGVVFQAQPAWRAPGSGEKTR